MNLRKVLAVLLSVTMVASLIVMPVSSAAVNDTGVFEDILPTEGSAPRDMIYSEIETISGAATASAGLDWTTVESLPLGGALYLDFSEGITGTSNSATNYITLHVDMEGSNGTISLQFGVDTSNTIRAQSGSGWTGANSAVAPYGTINLADGFELIVKHNTAGTADYWLKKAGEDEFTCTLAGVAIGANNNRTTGITAAGNAVANVTAATLYTAEEFFEVAYFEDILPSEGVEGDTIYEVENSVTAPALDTTGVALGGTIPAGGAVRYNFASVSSYAANSKYVEIYESLANGGSIGLHIGVEATSPNTNRAIRVHYNNGSTNSWYGIVARWKDVTLSEGFDLIITYDGSTLDFWLDAEGNGEYKLVNENVTPSTASRTSSIHAVGEVSANLTVAEKYVAKVVEKTYETATEDEILPKDGEVGDTIFENVAEIGAITLSGDTTATLGKSIPVGGAVHYQFSSVTTNKSGGQYVVLNEDIDGSNGANNMVLAATTTAAIRIKEGTAYAYPAEYDILDFAQPFEIIVKHNAENGKLGYWLKSNGEEDFKFLGEWAPENHNSRSSSYSVGGAAIANLTSAVMYGPTVKEAAEYDGPDESAGPALPDGIVIEGDLANYALVTTKDSSTEFRTDINEANSASYTIQDSVAKVTGAGSNLAWNIQLPEKGLAHIKLKSAVAYSNGWLHIASSDGKRIRFVFSASNNSLIINKESGTSTLATGVNFAQPFEILVQDTGTTLNYWVAQSTAESFTSLGSLGRPANAITRTEIGTGGNNNTVAVEYIKFYEEQEVILPPADLGTTTFEEIITTSSTIGEYTHNAVATLGATTIQGETTGSLGKSIPVGGAVHYVFSGLNATGGSHCIVLNEDIDGTNGASNLVLAVSGVASTADAIRVKNGSEYAYLVKYNEFDITQAFEIIVKHTAEGKLQYWLKSNGSGKFRLIGTVDPEANNTRSSSYYAGGTAVGNLVSATMYEYVENIRWYTEDEILPKDGEIGATIFESAFEADAAQYSGDGYNQPLFTDSAIPVNGAVHYKINGISAGGSTKYVQINEALANGGGLALHFGAETVADANNAIRFQSGTSWSNTIAKYGDISLAQPFELIVTYDGSTLDFYLKRTGDAGFKLVVENAAPCTNNRTSAVQITGAATLDLASAVIYNQTTKQAPVEVPGPAFPESIDLNNYQKVFEKDTDAQWDEGKTLTEGTGASFTTTNGVARVTGDIEVSWAAQLPTQGVAHIRVANAAAYANGGIDIASAGGKRIRFVFHNSNKTATINDGSTTRAISLAGINLSMPFDIIIQDTGSALNYWFGQTESDTYTITDTSAYPPSNKTTTALWTGNTSNTIQVDFIRFYEPDFGTPIENLINDKHFKLVETSGELSTDNNSKQYDLPLNGAVHYKFDGFAAATVITLSNTARNGGLYMAFNQNNTNQFQISHYVDGTNKNTPIVTAKSVLDASKPFELLVVTNEDSAEYFVKPNGKTKFTSLGVYGLAYSTNRPTTNTADVTSMTIYKTSTAPIVLTAGDDTAEVITNGTVTGGTVRVLFNNNMEAKGKIVIFVGLTNEGAVKAGDFETRIIQENEEHFNLTGFASSTIKVFFWDNMVSMTPVEGFNVLTFTK